MIDEHEYNARAKLCERVGALRGNISCAIEYLKGIEDRWAQQALRTLIAAYEADTKRAAEVSQ
jgi:hypothetical protein